MKRRVNKSQSNHNNIKINTNSININFNNNKNKINHYLIKKIYIQIKFTNNIHYFCCYYYPILPEYP